MAHSSLPLANNAMRIRLLVINRDIACGRILAYIPNWRRVGTSWVYVQLEMSLNVVAVRFQGLAGVLDADHVRFSLVPSRVSLTVAPSGFSLLVYN